MDRRLLALVSSNPDINKNRELALELIEQYNKTPHMATKEDVKWFDWDLDLEVDSETAWDYVKPKIKELSEMYPFLVTEWFEEFYRYMPELLPTGRENTGQIDWNLFFTLAYPLPSLPYLSFRSMINKLNVAQNRIVREQIKNEIWDNKELRRKVFQGEVIPSIYTNYIAYPTIRKALIERHKKQEKEMQKEKYKMFHTKSPQRKALEKVFRQVARLREDGVEVVFK